MNMEAIAGIAPAALAALNPTSSQSTNVATPNGFAQLVNQGLQQVNQQLLTSQVDLQHLAVGDAANLHQIMMHLEESRLSLTLMMQVRSRLLDAYQDITKMQI